MGLRQTKGELQEGQALDVERRRRRRGNGLKWVKRAAMCTRDTREIKLLKGICIFAQLPFSSLTHSCSRFAASRSLKMANFFPRAHFHSFAESIAERSETSQLPVNYATVARTLLSRCYWIQPLEAAKNVILDKLFSFPLHPLRVAFNFIFNAACEIT